MTGSSVLIVEDNIILGGVISKWMSKAGLDADTVIDEPSARKFMAEKDYSLVLADVRLPKGNGLRLLEWSMGNRHGIPFVVMTDYASVPDAVRAVKMGAEDYLPKPIYEEQLSALLRNILHRPSMFPCGDGLLERRSPAARKVMDIARRVAVTDWPVMVLGPNGSGKEAVAHTIHRHSGRKGGPFVAVNCGSVARELAESEFFGHVKGAFTGAENDSYGYFKAAEGGTLFLDEVGTMPLEVQAMMLRVLQEGVYYPVGSRKACKANVRIVSATNEDMDTAIREGRFREDLSHRLCGFEIRQPSLIECPEDILPLAEFFLRKYASELHMDVAGFTPGAKEALLVHAWNGNIRELSNMVRRCVLLAEGNSIGVEYLGIGKSGTGGKNGISERMLCKDEEKSRIAAALVECQGNITRTAKMLGCSRPTLYKRIREHGL